MKTYQSKLDLIETQIAIKKLKDLFEVKLAEKLNLTRVSAPLFVEKDSGLNDNLSGNETPVSFNICQQNLQIVHSLAKWKRKALKDYNFSLNSGLYTDMNAIRKDEKLSPIHSLYVDQWDWEYIIEKNERNETTLHKIVTEIFSVFRETELAINKIYPIFESKLPNNIHFITSQELLDLYPEKSEKEREYLITKEFKAVFIKNIGAKLSNGKPHDLRSPDYDDWSLNGDLLFYHPTLDIALELSSMGIRVYEDSITKQLMLANKMERATFPYHQSVIKNEVPYTIGGGIGQSRLCMFFLEKAHIGEVQCSYWTPTIFDECKKLNIHLL